jgi:hypothetical protein
MLNESRLKFHLIKKVFCLGKVKWKGMAKIQCNEFLVSKNVKVSWRANCF